LQGKQGRKDKRNDPDESDGKEDVVHGDQDVLAIKAFCRMCEQRHAM